MTLPKDQLAAMQQQVAAVAAYDTRYEGVAGEIIAERKQHIIESWVQDTSWSKRTRSRDYDATPDFVRLTAQFQSLAKLGQFTRAVEIGCGDGKYLAYLRGITATSITDWIATDLDGERLREARIETPEVIIEAADILECVARYNQPGTLFLAANVLGNIAPDDIYAFFKQLTVPNTALVLLAGGLSLESTKPFVLRKNGIAFDHNYFELLRASALVCQHYEVSFEGGAVGYWIAATTPRE